MNGRIFYTGTIEVEMNCTFEKDLVMIGIAGSKNGYQLNRYSNKGNKSCVDGEEY